MVLPGLQTEIRLTRVELEAMIRVPIAETIAALRRTIESAGIQPADLVVVLLVGGSSRIPMVAEMIGAELGRPAAVDADPKQVVALGAARLAAGEHLTTGVPVIAGAVAAAAAATGGGSVGREPGLLDTEPIVSVSTSAAEPLGGFEDVANLAAEEETSRRLRALVGIGLGIAALLLGGTLGSRSGGGGGGDAPLDPGAGDPASAGVACVTDGGRHDDLRM